MIPVINMTADLFNKKTYMFFTKKELNNFLSVKLDKIANAHLQYNKRKGLIIQKIYHSKNEAEKKMYMTYLTNLENTKKKYTLYLHTKINTKEGYYMNIGSNSKYPGNALSNFAPHPFTIDHVNCASMEGFLQALKTKSPERQKHICTLVGREAKAAGKGKDGWKKTQTVYWQGVAYKRDSLEFDQLITRAFDALAENKGFQRALKATQNAKLDHSIGKRKKKDTILTKKEFCNQLTRVRKDLHKNE